MSGFALSQQFSLSALRGLIFEAITKRIVWIRDERCLLDGTPTDDFALLAVIGREHYELATSSLPVRSWFDCRKIAKLENAEAPEVLISVGPLRDDRREVTCFRLHAAFDLSSVNAALWVPETFLLTCTAAPGKIIEVVRASFRYFLAPNGATQIAGAVVASPQLFAMAVGGAFDETPDTIDERSLGSRLRGAASALSALDWWGFLSPMITEGLKGHARPVGAAAAILLTTYLAFVSAYFELGQWWRERQLANLDTDVAALIVKQRNVDRLEIEHRGLAAVVNTPVWSYRVWELAALVWRSGGSVSNLSLIDGKVTLRGSVSSATELLRSISTLKEFSGAKFDAPVRRAEGPANTQEEFTITVQLRLRESR